MKRFNTFALAAVTSLVFAITVMSSGVAVAIRSSRMVWLLPIRSMGMLTTGVATGTTVS